MTLILPSTHEIAVHVEKLNEQAKRYISKAKAENTKKSYRSDWRDFEDWCKSNGYQSMPADPLTVVRYVTDRATNSWVKYIYKGRSKSKVPVVLLSLHP